MQREGVCIVGYGEIPNYMPEPKDVASEYSYMSLVAEAVTKALDNAGMKKKDIKGMAMARLGFPTDTALWAEEMGMELDWAQGVDAGGSSSVVSVRRAADAIQFHGIDAIICAAACIVHREKQGGGVPSYPFTNYQVPFGYGGPNTSFGLTQRRHMHEYGTTIEQLGKIAVSFRKNAIPNKNALFRKPLTIEEYVNSRVISSPIRLYDCVRPCTGAKAIVMASERIAKKFTDHPIYLVSDTEKVNYKIDDPLYDRGTTGFAALGDELFKRVKREAIDCAQLYDDYPIAVLMQLEDLGFCEKGKGGKFIEEHELTFDGNFPINTGGGQLSAGQPGGAGSMLHVVEAVRQLKGEADGRQVKNARTALVTGLGLLGYDIPIVIASGMILQRR